MGLLHAESGKPDHDAVALVADTVSTLWNEFGGKDYGFSLTVDEEKLILCADKGSEVLRQSFVTPPSPFKRVAALIVFARLYPFFQFEPDQNERSNNQWMGRVVAMLIPGALAGLQVNISKHPGVQRFIPLDKWRGFPSAHFKLEFLTLLESLDHFELPPITESWNDLIRNRIARMILAFALLIESSYYCSEELPSQPEAHNLRGKCPQTLSTLDLTPLSYDVKIYDDAVGRNSPLLSS